MDDVINYYFQYHFVLEQISILILLIIINILEKNS